MNVREARPLNPIHHPCDGAICMWAARGSSWSWTRTAGQNCSGNPRSRNADGKQSLQQGLKRERLASSWRHGWANQPPRQDKSRSATAICICLSPSKAPKSAAENNMRAADATEIQQKQSFTCRLLDCLVSEFRWETEKVTGSCGGHRRPSHAHVVVGTTGREEYAELQWTDQLSHSHTHTHTKKWLSPPTATERRRARSVVVYLPFWIWLPAVNSQSLIMLVFFLFCSSTLYFKDTLSAPGYTRLLLFKIYIIIIYFYCNMV